MQRELMWLNLCGCETVWHIAQKQAKNAFFMFLSCIWAFFFFLIFVPSSLKRCSGDVIYGRVHKERQQFGGGRILNSLDRSRKYRNWGYHIIGKKCRSHLWMGPINSRTTLDSRINIGLRLLNVLVVVLLLFQGLCLFQSLEYSQETHLRAL